MAGVPIQPTFLRPNRRTTRLGIRNRLSIHGGGDRGGGKKKFLGGRGATVGRKRNFVGAEKLGSPGPGFSGAFGRNGSCGDFRHVAPRFHWYSRPGHTLIKSIPFRRGR